MEAVRVLDERRWRLNCLWLDIVAVGLFAVLTFSLFYDMYSLGVSAAAAASGGAVVLERDGLAARMMGEAALAAVAFSWMSYRLLTGGYRALEGRR